MNNIETILKDKINEFSSFLISKCDNDDQIKIIQDKLGNLKFYELMLFITFLDNNRLDHYINELMNTINLQDSEEIRLSIKEYLIYFINVKQIFNDSMKK
jgi:hypothetical protein